MLVNTRVVKKLPFKYSEVVCEGPVTPLGVVDKNCKLKEALNSGCILTEDLCLHAYQVQSTHELKPNNHAERGEFVGWIIGNQQVDAHFSSKIILSYEAHVHLDGFVDRQNCRIRGERAPHVGLSQNKCIRDVSQFGAESGLEAPLGHTSAKMSSSDWRSMSRHCSSALSP